MNAAMTCTRPRQGGNRALVKMLDGWHQNLVWALLSQVIGSPPIAPLPFQGSIDQRSPFRAEYHF